MKHIKLFEDYRIIDKAPKWFYLVLRIEKAWDSLIKMEFNGVVGISDNPEIINSWFDVRDTLLIMDGEEFLRLNPNIHKIDYDNPNQLVSNNFFLLNRLLQNKENSIYFYDVCQKIFSNTESIKTNNNVVLKTSKFLNDCLYQIENLIETYVKEGKTINNVWDIVNIIWKNLDMLIEKQNKRGSWFTQYSRPDFPNKSILYYVIQEGIIKLTQSWRKEGEWIIKKDKVSGKRNFKVPQNSKLYFKIDITDEEEYKRMKASNKFLSHKGMSQESLKFTLELIETYHLDELYDIEFIQGHLKAFDIWKDEPIPNTITYSQLMKTHKGFPKKKKKTIKKAA